MRHIVNVMRPTKSKGTLGETQGEPEVVMRNVPCSIKTLTGTEQERARQNGVTATYKVEMYGDPSKPIDEKCFLQMGTRTLNVSQVEDVAFNGVQLVLLCGENK